MAILVRDGLCLLQSEARQCPPGWSSIHISIMPFSKPTWFLSSPVNSPLQDTILPSFYSPLFGAIIWVVITDALVAGKGKGVGCVRTAAQALPGLMRGCQPPRAGGKLELRQLLFQNLTSVTEPGIIRL